MQSFILQGLVQVGQGQGESLGAKTANLDICLAVKQGLPKGLYRAVVLFRGEHRDALLYYGINFFTKQDCLEVHLFNFSGELYGETVVVTTGEYLRPPKEFNSSQELKDQIKKDLERQ